MTSIYKTEVTPEQQRVLEDMSSRIGRVLGVTLTGNRLTVRWNVDGGALVDVHMIIESVTTPTEAKQELLLAKLQSDLCEKYPDLEDQLFFAQYGEWPQ